MTRTMLRLGVVCFFGLALPMPMFVGCGGHVLMPTDDAGTGGDDGGAPPPAPLKVPGCVGACTVNMACPGGSPTTITGTVNIPAGTLPIYNAKVYIPTGDALPSSPITGATCDVCDKVDRPYSATTDFNGKFTLTNVPSGQNVPLIVSVGKWRRVVTLPSVADCATTQVDPDKSRLPRNHTEGDIPKIALSTGGQDALECLLRSKKLGLDDSEITPPAGTGRVNLFAGGYSFNQTAGTNSFAPSLNGGAAFPPSSPWWNDINNWRRYDIVLLSCEGDQNASYKTAAAHAALQSYINMGGRVFASHWHNVWISGAAAPLNSVASFVSSGGYVNDQTAILADINQDPAFAKGAALAQWLQSSGATTTLGKLPINYSRVTLTGRNGTVTQDWVDYTDGTNLMSPLVNPASQYFSFNAPIGATPDSQCGQMVFTDIHVSGGKTDVSSPSTPFPTGCTSTSLTPQEKALIFMLFDLTNCLQPVIG